MRRTKTGCRRRQGPRQLVTQGWGWRGRTAAFPRMSRANHRDGAGLTGRGARSGIAKRSLGATAAEQNGTEHRAASQFGQHTCVPLGTGTGPHQGGYPGASRWRWTQQTTRPFVDQAVSDQTFLTRAMRVLETLLCVFAITPRTPGALSISSTCSDASAPRTRTLSEEYSLLTKTSPTCGC